MPTRRGDTHAAWAWLRELATQTPGVVGMALLELASKWEFLEQSVTRWDERIEALVDEMPEVGSIERSIPGVGKVLAALDRALGECGQLAADRGVSVLRFNQRGSRKSIKYRFWWFLKDYESRNRVRDEVFARITGSLAHEDMAGTAIRVA